MFPRPRQLIIGAAGEDDLEQLQRASGEGRNRAREIQPPGAHEVVAVYCFNLPPLTIEAREPVFQGLGVAAAVNVVVASILRRLPQSVLLGGAVQPDFLRQ